MSKRLISALLIGGLTLTGCSSAGNDTSATTAEDTVTVTDDLGTDGVL